MRIRSVAITVGDPAGYADFLRRALGLDGTGDEVLAGTSRILLPAGTPSVQHIAFTVPTGTFDDAVARLADRVPLLARDGRTEFAGPPSWESRSVYFDGPDAHVLELIERRRLPRSGPPIACVSEVGIAVPDVEAAVADLAALGLGAFGAVATDFAAVGDEDGLLILATEGRPWLPTSDRLAALADVTVRIGDGRTVTVGGATVVGAAPTGVRLRAAG